MMLAPELLSALASYAATQDWQYIYPVWSRRAQGISIGINLHPHHCCNWHCIYCQVPNLQRGPSPAIVIDRLQHEIEDCLDWISHQITAHHLDQMPTLVKDIAFAGDGEPTTSPQFGEAMLLLSHLLNQRQPNDRPYQVRLITNGSQLQHAHLQHALQELQHLGGEVWFKLDAGCDAEMQAINDSYLPLALHLQRLKICCGLCKTWVQTAIVSRRIDQHTVTTPALPGYLKALQPLQNKIAGILLYGTAWPSQQASAACLQPISESVIQDYARELRAQGFHVRAFS